MDSKKSKSPQKPKKTSKRSFISKKEKKPAPMFDKPHPAPKSEKKEVKKQIHNFNTKPDGKNDTGRPKKRETPEELEVQINRYFDSLSITKPKSYTKDIPEDEDTEYEVIRYFSVASENAKGKKIVKNFKTIDIPVLNNLGEQIMETEWYEEPTVAGLAIYLDVDPKTILNYECKQEFFPAIKKGKTRIMKQYEGRLVRRGNGGDIFAMKNFGMKDKIEIEAEQTNIDGGSLTEEKKKAILDRMKLM